MASIGWEGCELRSTWLREYKQPNGTQAPSSAGSFRANPTEERESVSRSILCNFARLFLVYKSASALLMHLFCSLVRRPPNDRTCVPARQLPMVIIITSRTRAGGSRRARGRKWAKIQKGHHSQRTTAVKRARQLCKAGRGIWLVARAQPTRTHATEPLVQFHLDVRLFL